MKKFALIALGVSALALGACSQVDAGERGMFTHYGNIDEETVGPGLHWYFPVTTGMVKMNIQSTPWAGTTPIYTKDLQTANVKFNITTSLNPGNVVSMYKTVGDAWREKLIPPLVEATVKDVFGQFDAKDAISKRPVMQAQMLEALRTRFRARGINVESFQITNIDYSDAFEEAVEAAQVATQNAIAAQNATVRVTEEGKQTVIKANADAESIRVQANAISSNPAIVTLKWVEKWNGQMPSTVYCSSTTPCVQGGK